MSFDFEKIKFTLAQKDENNKRAMRYLLSRSFTTCSGVASIEADEATASSVFWQPSFCEKCFLLLLKMLTEAKVVDQFSSKLQINYIEAIL